MTQPQTARREKRLARRRSPKGGTKARCYKSTLGLGPDVALAVLDISETGARLLLRAPVKPGQEVEVDLEHIAYRPVKVQAQVIWAIPTADGHYCVGTRFDRPISYADLRSLARD